MTAPRMGFRALFHVQHLLGTGHLVRTAAIARALAARGVAVTLVSGGEPVPLVDMRGLDLVQLPSVRSPDATFGRLVDAAGHDVGPDLWQARQALLRDTLARVSPHLVVVEQFPFGRRKLAVELVPFLEAVRALAPRPVITGSLRDVLTAKDSARNEEMAERALALLDAVLVHGDPAFVRLDASFPPTRRIAGLVHYTGYVAEPPEPRVQGGAGDGEVLVSAGGGAVGAPLLEVAVDAARASPHPWRILVGGRGDVAPLAARARDIAPRVTIEPARPDFRALLANCAVSVSQGGYNTVVDVLAARARAVIVPFAREGQSEQAMRARLLAEAGLVHTIEEHALDPVLLAAMVERAMAAQATRSVAIDLDGAPRSAALLQEFATQGHAELGRAARGTRPLG